MSDATTDQPFRLALHGLVAQRGEFTTGMGNVNWARFAATLPTIHYETLRKLLAGERALDMAAIEEIATAAQIDPHYFGEYRLLEAQRLFDVREVGYEAALENLRAYLAAPPAEVAKSAGNEGGRKRPSRRLRPQTNGA